MSFLTFTFSLGLLAAILSSVPFVTRSSESFGINVGTKLSGSKQILKWKRQYAFLMGFLAIGLFLVSFIFSWFSSLLLFYIACSFGIYLVYHFRTKTFKKQQIAEGNLQEQAMVIVEASGSQHKWVISGWYYLIPFLFFLLTLFLTVIFYEQAPAKLPAYWKLNGIFETEKAKTPFSASIWLGSQLLAILTFLGLHATIQKSKRIIDQDDPEISLERMKRSRRLCSKVMFGAGLLTVLFFGFLQGSFLLDWSSSAVQVISRLLWLLLPVCLLWMTFFIGQGGSRLKVMGIRRERKIVQKDDHYWKLGIFYFNRSDSALFVEKRFGIGWTVNLGRPIVWIILFVVLALAGIKQFFFS